MSGEAERRFALVVPSARLADRRPADEEALRSTINLTNTDMHIKKNSSHAILKGFANELKLLPLGPLH